MYVCTEGEKEEEKREMDKYFQSREKGIGGECKIWRKWVLFKRKHIDKEIAKYKTQWGRRWKAAESAKIDLH